MLAVAVATLIATLLDFTLEEAVVHHGYRALVRGDTAGLLGLFRTSLFLDVAIGSVVTAGIVLLASPLANLASAGHLDPGLVRLAALVTLPSSVDSTTSAVLQVAGRPDLRGWLMAWANLARLVAVVLAIQIGTPEAIIVAWARYLRLSWRGGSCIADGRRKSTRLHSGSRSRSSSVSVSIRA